MTDSPVRGFKELISISKTAINDKKISTVNARDLHAFLGVGKDFSSWIKGRIEEYEFVDGVDFITTSLAPPFGGAKRGGNRNPVTEYHLSIGMGKELSMVEKTPRGREARLYFIKCEEVAIKQFMDEATSTKLALFLAEEMRPWQKTFPDELWIEFARLTGREIEGSQRPQYWGKLVNEFIYGYLDADVKDWLKENAPKSASGKRYHQHLNEEFGLRKLTEHMWLVIGTARNSFSIKDLRNRLELQFNRDSQLSFFVPRQAIGM